jgi:gamma-glutamyl hercynylcysteine S-oxide synthase
VSLTDELSVRLTEARARTLALLEPLAEPDLRVQHSPLMSPLVWDLAHIGNYEDQWLLRALAQPGVGDRYDDLYDAFRHPRRTRTSLPLLGPTAARAYVHDVRNHVLDHLHALPPNALDGHDRLLDRGFVYSMVVQHEHQHDETVLATLQLMAAPGYRAAAVGVAAAPGVVVGSWPAEVLVGGGPFVMGTSDDPAAYDNERPAHLVDIPAYWIDATPVTNDAYVAFVESGGYDEERWWTPHGWAWRVEAGLAHPQFWQREGTGWMRDRFGIVEPLPLGEPVQHVCWYEADACARFLGKRLPTEQEWEKAASWDAAAGGKRCFPWGDDEPTVERASLGQHHLGPAAVGAHPAGASAYGCLAMVGDVWEWTSSSFAAYPGTEAFPYREYSEVFYGPDYKVLRGGSWATHPTAVRTTFRNWDYPIRRQIFAGFRCARDAD